MVETQSRNSIEDIWGERHGYYGEWNERIDYRAIEEPERWVQSACLLCSNGCGMDVGVKGNQIVAVRGRGCDRVNRGRLGPKGMHASIGLNQHEDRLLYPQIRDSKTKELRRATWDEAMEYIVNKTKAITSEYTQHAVSFYTSGQLMLEEYYALAIVGKAGISTNHMDGNTRLCTATAAAAMRESFGSDGQPGSYTDIDVADCIFLTGHNMSATQTVLWSRILDRLAGPQPPKIVVIDPRQTPCADQATVHLAPKIGTNMAVLNGIQRYLIHHNMIDNKFITEHLVGFTELRTVVETYTPEHVERLSGVPSNKLIEAAIVLGSCTKLLSTCLQGVYQSYQATASACQINNINLLRGKIGKPGCGILQMNGQPTAQNNRECGCDGEFTGFRNYQNPEHIATLARHWNVEPERISHWFVPTHIMEILHYISNDTIKMIWISGTNPAVSLPELGRIRKLLSKEDLFVVAQDIFPTETTKFADVILPAAMWSEKTGTYTNVDRTVHISDKAVEPPGEARSDLDIFLDFARRMKFVDKDGQPLLPWSTPEEVFNAWAKCTEGTLCDYTGITYNRLRGGSGIQWPCNKEHPNGTERLYTDYNFPTTVERCEVYGHDLVTGAAVPKPQYLANDYPNGRAILKAAHYYEPEEKPSKQYPYWLSTGRVTHQFHTRTKTGRNVQLQAKCPEPFVQINELDAQKLGIVENDMVTVSSKRSSIQIKARIGGIERSCVFIPFHYGYWDQVDNDTLRAANELTSSSWDPVSKQPYLKYGVVHLEKCNNPQITIHKKPSAIKSTVKGLMKEVTTTATALTGKTTRQHYPDHIGRLVADMKELREMYITASKTYEHSWQDHAGFEVLAEIVGNILKLIQPFERKYNAKNVTCSPLFKAVKAEMMTTSVTNYGTVQNVTNLYTIVQHCDIQVTSLQQMSNANKDKEFTTALSAIQEQVNRQTLFLTVQIKSKSAQALLVPE